MKVLCRFFKWLFYLDGVEWWRIPRREHYKSSKTPFQQHLEAQEACEHQFTRVENYWGDSWACSKCGKPMEESDWHDR